MKPNRNIAVLLTCHNRREKTLTCLHSLFHAKIPANHTFEVFLVDDGSSDGTGEAVKEAFPSVNIIQGNGQLYWNRGMRLAWDTAATSKEFDFYVWLNDDTVLDSDALSELINNHNAASKLNGNPFIIVGACRDSKDSLYFSYGGRNNKGPVLPNGHLQECIYINGNLVLVPKEIFKVLGNLSKEYTHAIGDNDYGLRAIEKGFHCLTTKKYLAICPQNEGIPGWCNPKLPLKKRWELFHSPRGLNIKEYNTFRKKYWGFHWIGYALKAYIKMLIPQLYFKYN